MTVRNPERTNAEVESMIELAQLLERIERNPTSVNADQYRSVVERLSENLRAAPHDEILEGLLSSSPAAAELYENLNYQHAGLSRAPLDQSVQAELATSEALKRFAKAR